MNASKRFRSHLMQQFASASRGQSPAMMPLAMMPWMASASDGVQRKQDDTLHVQSERRSFASQRHNHNSGDRSSGTASWSTSSLPRSTLAGTTSVAKPTTGLASLALSSVAEDAENSHNDKGNEEVDTAEEPQHDDETAIESSTLAQQLQRLIITRRTTSHFQYTENTTESEDSAAKTFWMEALERGVACGRRAPNHKRTEPFFFKRMIAPSPATKRLAEIAYYVNLQKTSATPLSAGNKRDKWQRIPAFLVAMAESKEELYPAASALPTDDDKTMYQALPFVPLQTEREMEDYAATCAAVQNVLLSLHSENIASKWATGPVINTRAFRELVGATPNDRIVALVMIGLPKGATMTVANNNEDREEPPPAIDTGSISGLARPRRFRRQWDEFLQDL